MDTLVRNAICQYRHYQSELQLLEKCLDQTDDPASKASISLLSMKVGVIEAWLNLLNTDERFVVQKHLIEQIEWPRVAFEYRERWQKEFTRTERSLQVYQAEALSKIALFADKHKDITLRLFSDVIVPEINDVQV